MREEGLGREAAAGEGWCAGSVSHLGIDALLGQPDQHCERLSVEPRLQQLREVVQGCAARRREVSGGGAGGAGIARARLAMRHRPYRLVGCPCPHACRREGKQENAVSGIPRCVFYVPPLGETQSAEPTLGDPWYMALVRPRTPQGQGSLLPAAARPRASGPLGALLYTLAPRPCLGVRLPSALEVIYSKCCEGRACPRLRSYEVNEGRSEVGEGRRETASKRGPDARGLTWATTHSFLKIPAVALRPFV